MYLKECICVGLYDDHMNRPGTRVISIEFVGWDARTANERRAQQARRSNARRARCEWASAGFEHAGAMYGSGCPPWQRDAGRSV